MIARYVDYKTAVDAYTEHDAQLQIYSDARRREGLNVRAAYLHDLNAGKRKQIDISKPLLDASSSRDLVPHAEGATCALSVDLLKLF